jgi:DNA-binding response OmpR family regulator
MPQTNPPPSRILIAEDDPVTGDLMRVALEHAGYRVTIARDGHEAWETVRESAFEVLISDVSMPDMQGTELVKRIRSLDDVAKIAVILVTAKAYEIDVRDLGVARVFSKPFSPSELVHAVENVLADQSE